jgi:hypothetical protein
MQRAGIVDDGGERAVKFEDSSTVTCPATVPESLIDGCDPKSVNKPPIGLGVAVEAMVATAPPLPVNTPSPPAERSALNTTVPESFMSNDPNMENPSLVSAILVVTPP